MDTRTLVIGSRSAFSNRSSSDKRPQEANDANPHISLHAITGSGEVLVTRAFRLQELRRFSVVGAGQLGTYFQIPRPTRLNQFCVLLHLNRPAPSQRAIQNVHEFMEHNATKTFDQSLRPLCPSYNKAGTLCDMLDTRNLSIALRLRPISCTSGLDDMIRREIAGAPLLAQDLEQIFARVSIRSPILSAALARYDQIWSYYEDDEMEDLVELCRRCPKLGRRLDGMRLVRPEGRGFSQRPGNVNNLAIDFDG